MDTSLKKNEQFVAELESSAKSLVEKLQNSQFEAASELIHGLIEARDRHIFNSVGQLTRGLHNAIVNFHVDACMDNQTEDKRSDIHDASDRLNYVMEMTQDAANKTMDKVEATAPIAENLGQEASKLREEWRRLKEREMTTSEFKLLYKRMNDFLGQMDDGTKQLNKNLQDILLEQGYQDLTGQVLKRVIGLITDVEAELVNLLRIAGQVEEITGLTEADACQQAVASHEAEGPQIHADKRDDVVSGQDDVDDLLSSLGF